MLAAVLAVGTAFPSKEEAPEFLQPLYALAEWMGKPAVLGVSAFAAYLLGSVLMIRADTIASLISYLLVRVRQSSASMAVASYVRRLLPQRQHDERKPQLRSPLTARFHRPTVKTDAGVWVFGGGSNSNLHPSQSLRTQSPIPTTTSSLCSVRSCTRPARTSLESSLQTDMERRSFALQASRMQRRFAASQAGISWELHMAASSWAWEQVNG
ncbi:hypothetical protein ACFVZW_36670 [Streptomyces sp. NPDC059567]|uniref:hypothetical protein n=1 Tax=Streptomyces sp. NPDC059567 TaxID=3346867 RepID=UPI0036CF5514